jgi:hypothetical protein
MVADLSQASGWEILDCPSDWDKGSVDVRLVCTTSDPEANCHHVIEEGAENTIVRLPSNCGAGPFARVAQWTVSKDQSIPSGSVADRKLRRRNLTPEVVAATLDYRFTAIPADRGTVTFDVVAAHHADIKNEIKRSNVARALHGQGTGPSAVSSGDAPSADFGIPGLPDIDLPDIDLPTLPSIDLPDLPSITMPDISLPTLPSIDLPDLPSITLPDIHLPTFTMPDITLPDLSDLPSLPTKFPDLGDIEFPDIDIPSLEELPIPSLPDLSAGYEKSKGFEAVNLKKNISLLDESLGCNFGKIGFDQSAKITVDADILINAGYAFKIAGSLVPPEIKDFAIAGALSGKVHADFGVDMYLAADILFPPIKILGVGIPGLFIPGIITLGPKAALVAQLDLAVDVAFAAKIPMKYDFDRLDFVLPSSLAPAGGEGRESKKTTSFEMNVSPGDQTGSFGLHIIPKLEFGVDVFHDLAHAEIYAGIDVDATFNSNGTIFPDYSYEGCQDLSVGALVKAGVSAGAIKILSVGDYIPIYEKRMTLWKHCSKQTDGPATAVYDNGDGTFSNAAGDLVNENGQLIDEKGEVIADADAEDAAPPPIKGEDGNDIPEEELILDNGDGTYEDAWGNATTKEGQRISNNGTILACELDLSQPLTDADGNVVPPEEAIFDAGDGLYSNSKCEIVNEDGQLVDSDGNVIDYEDFKDETGAVIPPTEVVIDEEDGTYTDPFGNPVDQWGGAIDFDENGDVIPVELTPAEEDDGTQLPREEEVDTDPEFTIMTPEQLEQLALDLIHGKAPAENTATGSSTPVSTDAPSTQAPPSTSTDAPSTDAPSTDAPSTEAPQTTSADAPATTDAPTTTQQPTLNPNPIPVPTGACKASPIKKRTLVSQPARPSPSHVSRSHMRRRAILGKRSGFGCTMPSIGGLPLPPVPGFDELARLF